MGQRARPWRATWRRGAFRASSSNEITSLGHTWMKNWHEFVTCYYRLNVMFTYFLMNPKYRLDVLKLLQGDVYDEDSPPALEKMKSVILRVEQDKTHRWRDYLGEMTANAFLHAMKRAQELPDRVVHDIALSGIPPCRPPVRLFDGNHAITRCSAAIRAAPSAPRAPRWSSSTTSSSARPPPEIGFTWPVLLTPWRRAPVREGATPSAPSS